ncbi:anthrone oxygenase family protein [Nonomuraea sp. NPDC005983]|uniref:anthrone oxygenase family protein n=1 Tax=Nonomuraea sp. NPDC005983 TaxID=3155595 RepID=UPI00339DFABE
MLSVLALIAAALAIVLNGLMAGAFHAFSTSVVPGLDAVAADQAAESMRSMNRKILNPRFLSAFVLAPVASVAAGGLVLPLGQSGAAIAFFAAGVVYFVGALMVTGAVNVPLNNALEAGEVQWQGFSPRWTRWNTLRTVSSVISLLLLVAGLYFWR